MDISLLGEKARVLWMKLKKDWIELLLDKTGWTQK